MNTALAAVLVGLPTVIASVIVALIAKSGGKGSTANAFAKNLMDRIDQLEAGQTRAEERIEELEGKLTLSQRATVAAVRFIDKLVAWGKAGGVAPMPTPSNELHEYLDPGMWEKAKDGPAA